MRGVPGLPAVLLLAGLLCVFHSVTTFAQFSAPPPGDLSSQVEADYQDYLPRMVFFPAAAPPGPSAFQQRIAKEKGIALEAEAATEVVGRLYLPEGEGAHPAVVLLHGTGGIWDWDDVWAARLRDWGYVVLNVDSFSPRGLYRHNLGSGETETGLQRRIVGAFPRALDALGAADYLAGQPFVAGRAIAVLGAAQGGMAAMQALSTENPRNEGQFKAGVALYAPCDQLFGLTAPLLVLEGAADQFISTKRCMQNIAPLQQAGKAELVIYPGATHQFDYDGPDRDIAGRPLRYDAAAAADAVERIKAFLAETIGSAG